MSRADVAARLPAILNSLNPKGRNIPARPRAPETRQWKRAIETALDRRNSRSQRLAGAQQAVNLATIMQPTDHRLGLAMLTQGRIQARQSPGTAASAFNAAYAQFVNSAGTPDIRAAHVALHLGLFALRDGRLDEAIAISRQHIPIARNAENAVVLSGLLAIEAEAHLVAGNLTEAKKTRLESLAWARYAFGDEEGLIRKAQAQIAAFNPNASASQ